MHQPKLLFLDEPFSGLDPVAASSLRGTIVELAREHRATVFLTTHDLAHVEKACDRVAVIGNGRLVAEGTPGSVGGDSGEIEVEVAGTGLDAALLERLQAEAALLRFSIEARRTRVWCTPAARAKLGPALVRHGVEIEELHTVRRSLEDAFLSLVGR
jgi:ABC-2 type transport system ATP-binding protein